MEAHLAPPPYQQRAIGSQRRGQCFAARADPDWTPAERVSVEDPQQTTCPSCRKMILTQVQKKRGKLERNLLTDTVFKTVAILVAPFDQEFIHSCPACGQRFKLYRMEPHRHTSSSQYHFPREPLSSPPPYQRREHDSDLVVRLV